ncbi:cell wall-binding protein [Bacillus cereus group sp. N21]|uniref:cell wall-binding protein n=1 Tax=Bacillus cereus group sp. N21 TaxID=2794591 RepID=UPI0018F5C2B3|nr:cell wall-binding protein [Bacillus cereus group sp. N21]MBJ8031920.1 cell wall-binding protein [Bacillus cereus group sp. N21]
MNGKAKKSMRKVLPVGIAMGILFSSNPVTEHKVKADVDTFGTIVTTLGSVYDAFGKEAFTKYLEDANAKSSYDNFWENITYLAPTFKKGEFGITVFDYYKNQDFSQKVKIAYPNGKVEYKTIKHGQQLRIKDAGTVVDLTPDEPELSKHDILYITQKQLDEGKTGVSLTNFKTYYLESDNSGRINELGWKFVKQQFPNAYLSSGLAAAGVNERELFGKLPEDKRMLGTSTSKTVGKEALSNYVTNDPEALADFNNRIVNVVADTNLIFEANLVLEQLSFDGDTIYQIIPYKKGSNKVVLKKGSKYLSGKEGNELQYSDSIGDDEVLELVQIENSGNNKFQFNLINKNGARLTDTPDHGREFTTNKGWGSNIRFAAKSNNEIHNWLREWYPGKENDRQEHDGIELLPDEKDPTKRIARDSSRNVIKNSWVKLIDNYFYAGSDGFLLKGWQEIEGNTYYFDPSNGELFTARNKSDVRIEGKFYNFNDSGALQRSAWSKSGSDGRCYSDASGELVEKGLREIDGEIYYFGGYVVLKHEIRLEDQNSILHFSDKGALERVSRINGEELSITTTVRFEDKELVFEKDGSIRKNGVSKISIPGLNLDGKEQPLLVYYGLEEGANYTGWKEVDGKKYHFDGGRHFTFDGHETIDGIKYYFNHEGEAKQTGFVKTNGKTYYYNDKGEMQTGWQKINDKWHSFEDSGEATVGSFIAWSRTSSQFGQYSFYAKDNGEIYVNETVVLPTENGYKKHIFDSYGHYTIDNS